MKLNQASIRQAQSAKESVEPFSLYCLSKLMLSFEPEARLAKTRSETDYVNGMEWKKREKC